MPSPDAFESLVARLDYPMLIVTAADGGTQAGCLVGFWTQASIDPPRLMVMISKKNHTYRVAAHADHFVIHFLSTRNLELAELFGESTGDQIDKFARCEWTASPDGSPVLKDTLGWIAARILSRADVGDHVAHLVEPLYGESEEPAEQLGFQAVRSLQPGHEA